MDELKPWPLFGYAPGGYLCKCTTCGEQFQGDKRAIMCLPCAAREANERLRTRPAPGASAVEEARGIANSVSGYIAEPRLSELADDIAAALSRHRPAPDKSAEEEAERIVNETWGYANWDNSGIAIKRIAAALAAREGREELDAVYRERNQCVALLARMALEMGMKAGMARTNIPGWDEDWHGCVYIELPTGQASWHFHDRELPLFEDLPPYTGEWDGHDTPEKYARVNAALRAREGK